MACLLMEEKVFQKVHVFKLFCQCCIWLYFTNRGLSSSFSWQSKAETGETWQAYVEEKQQQLYLCFILCKTTEMSLATNLQLCQALASLQDLQQHREGLKLKDEMLYSTSQVKTSQSANRVSEQHYQCLHIFCPALRKSRGCVAPEVKEALLGDQQWWSAQYTSAFQQ